MIPALDPNTPYHLYPDGPIVAEALRIIGVAMAETTVACIGRLSRATAKTRRMIEIA